MSDSLKSRHVAEGEAAQLAIAQKYLSTRDPNTRHMLIDLRYMDKMSTFDYVVVHYSVHGSGAYFLEIKMRKPPYTSTYLDDTMCSEEKYHAALLSAIPVFMVTEFADGVAYWNNLKVDVPYAVAAFNRNDAGERGDRNNRRHAFYKKTEDKRLW